MIDALLHEDVAVLLRHHRDGQQAHEDDSHGGQHGPALPGIADHDAERVAERGGDQQNRQQLEEIRQRRRVLERVRGIDVEEAAAVGAELLDGDLRGDGTDRDDLLGQRGLRRLHHRGLRGRTERLHDPLGDEDEREGEGERQQDVDGRAREIDPEVADGGGRASRERTDKRHQDRHARRRRQEVLHGQRGHLREIAHRALAAVPLPVRVGGEAHRGVERGIRRDRTEPLRVERQHALQALQRVDDQHAGRVEEQHRRGVRLPAHLLRGPHPGQAVDQPLEPAEHPLEPERPARVDGGHEGAQRLDEREQHDQVQRDLEDPAGRHEKSSGFSSASTRYTSSPTDTTPPTI